jgi:predicted ester cyclase
MLDRSTEANKALVRLIFDEGFNQGNLAVIDEAVDPTYVGHGRTAAADVHGPEGAKQVTTWVRDAFPDVHYTVEDQIAEGDKVVTRFTVRGTHQGETWFDGVGLTPPTGKRSTVTGIFICRIVDSKAVEGWLNTDGVGFLLQLGLLSWPEPAQSA